MGGMIRNDETTSLAYFEANRRLAHHFSWRWGDDLGDEGLQVAFIAVWKAAQQFDSSRGMQFSTYAVTKIRSALADERRRQRGGKSQAPKPLSLEVVIAHQAHGDEETLGDVVAAYDPATAEIMAVRSAVEALPARHRYVVEQVDFVGRIGKEVGTDLGISGEMVNRLRRQALSMLRERLAA